MEQVWIPDRLSKFYAFSMCLMVFTTAEVSWLMGVPRPIVYILAFLSSAIIIKKKGACFSTNRILWIFIWFAYNMLYFFLGSVEIMHFCYCMMFFFFTSAVLILPLSEMRYLLKAITTCFVVILSVSLVGWILFLSGVPLPHEGPIFHSNNFHVYFDYYFFTTQVSRGEYMRFSSVFLEPGQMATPCVFLFHLNTRNEKIFCYKNMIMLVSIIMSFSLISYGLLILSLISNAIARNKFSRNKMVWLTMTLFVLGGLAWYFISHENNAVHKLIVSRLEYDEESNKISGYNRTGENFEFEYAMLMNTSDKYFGIQNKLSGKEENWTTKASGYKKFIVFHGIVGLAIVLLLLLILFWDNCSKASLVFFVMVFLAFWVRNMLTTPLWLTITIVGMYIIGSDTRYPKLNTNFEHSIIKT